MNIVLINHYAGSPEMGMEFRPYYLAREWVKMGHRVRIIAGDFSHLRIRNPKVKKDFQRENIDGIEYYWVRTGDYQGNGVKRALTMFRFVGKLWLSAGKIAEKWKPDVVITSSTYPLDTYAGQRIAKKAGARLIHEVHDMWPATLYEIGGMSRNNPFVLLMQAAENSAYQHSDKIVSLLPMAKEYMIKHGMEPDKFEHISNGVVEEEWENAEPLPDKHRKFFQEKKKEGIFIVGYFGGHALSNALDILLDVAKKTDEKKIVYVLVGNGPEKKRLIIRKEKEKIHNLFFLPSVSKKEVPSLLSYFDCIYMGAASSPLYRFGVCLNKLYDSMMGGKPIICAITAPKTPIEEFGAGIMTSSEDIEEILKTITTLKEMKQCELKRMGINGKAAVLNHFTYYKLAAQFAALFEERKDEYEKNATKED